VLKAIEFGKSSEDEKIEEEQEKTRQSYEEKKYAEKTKERYGYSPDEIEKVLPKPTHFPSQPVKNPKQRIDRVSSMHRSESDIKRQKRERTIRTGRSNIHKKPYLEGNYTNEDGILVCQLCQNGLNGKLISFQNGDKFYYEAVEIFNRPKKNFTNNELTKASHANSLLLCPLCSAKFNQLVQKDTNQILKIKDTILNKPDDANESELFVDIELNGESQQLRFVQKHWLDIKGVLISEESAESD